jgi:adenosine/AMP kinase
MNGYLPKHSTKKSRNYPQRMNGECSLNANIERAHALRLLTRSTVPLNILNKVCTHSRNIRICTRSNSYCMLLQVFTIK